MLGAGRREVQCSLVLQGWGLTAPGVKFVSMTCSSTGIADGSVMQFGYNATQLRRFTSLAPGGVNNSSIQFRLVDNIPCQRAAEQGGFAALLFFCQPDVHLTLLQPKIVDVFLDPRNSKAAVLAAAGGARVSINGGSFIRNSMGSVLLVAGSARVAMTGLQADRNNGTSGAVASVTSNASLTIMDSTLTACTTEYGAAVSADKSASVSINNSVITGGRASGWGGALAAAGSTRLLLHNCTVSGNKAKDGGGAVSLAAAAQVRQCPVHCSTSDPSTTYCDTASSQ